MPFPKLYFPLLCCNFKTSNPHSKIICCIIIYIIITQIFLRSILIISKIILFRAPKAKKAMPAWINIVYRVVLAVCIQMQCVGLICFASVCILGQESGVLRIIKPCIVVVQSAASVIDLTCVADLVVKTCSARHGGAAVCCCEAGGAFSDIFVVQIPALAVSCPSGGRYDVGACPRRFMELLLPSASLVYSTAPS